MKKFLALLLAALLGASMFTLLAATPESALAAETTLVNAQNATENKLSTEDAADNASRSNRTAFGGAFADEFAQLDALRATAKANWAALRTANAQNKAALSDFHTRIKALPAEQKTAKVNALKAALGPLHDAMRLAHADIQRLRADKTVAWVNFRQAVRTGNQPAAQAALDQILSLKSSIIAKQNGLLALKQQAYAVITAA